MKPRRRYWHVAYEVNSGEYGAFMVIASVRKPKLTGKRILDVDGVTVHMGSEITDIKPTTKKDGIWWEE